MCGVDVCILLFEKCDYWIVWLVSYVYEDMFVQCGIKVYCYIDGFLYQKVMLFDDDLVFVGIVNFDNWFFQINFEMIFWFMYECMIVNVVKMLEEDFVQL